MPLTYTYVFHGVYRTYEDDTIISEVDTITFYPDDRSCPSVARALHNALMHFYTIPGYWSSFTVIERHIGGGK